MTDTSPPSTKPKKRACLKDQTETTCCRMAYQMEPVWNQNGAKAVPVSFLNITEQNIA